MKTKAKTDADLKQLETFLQAIYPISNKAWEDFKQCWEAHEFKRKTVLTQAGTTERYLYFVIEGVQRSYYLTEEGRDVSIIFTYPFSFSGVADSFLNQTPSLYHFETLSKSRLLRCEYSAFSKLMEEYSDLKSLLFTVLSRVLKGTLERQIELQCFSAEQKFAVLFKRSPHVFQLIPHKYLASYLGMDAATFSKLLSKNSTSN